MIGPRTRAILAPNLIGNAPDWDAHPGVADRHGLQVVEDSCDALGLTLRGTPTGTRADISLTSFALSHIITAAGTGGMVCFDDDALADRALLLRRWGRRSEVQLFGSRRASTSGSSRPSRATEARRLEYDNLFIFDELGWNFEPSELSAAFGLVQLDKLGDNLARRQRNFARTAEHFARWPAPVRAAPAHRRPRHRLAHVPAAGAARGGIRRADLQEYMGPTASTPAWCGPATSPASPRSATWPTGAARRAAERRPGHGVGPGPAEQPRHGRRRLRPHRRRASPPSWPSGAGMTGSRDTDGATSAHSARFAGPGAGHRRQPGIGAAVAERLAAEGADVAVTARTLDAHDHLAGSLTETAARVERHGRAGRRGGRRPHRRGRPGPGGARGGRGARRPGRHPGQQRGGRHLRAAGRHPAPPAADHVRGERARPARPGPGGGPRDAGGGARGGS